MKKKALLIFLNTIIFAASSNDIIGKPNNVHFVGNDKLIDCNSYLEIADNNLKSLYVVKILQKKEIYSNIAIAYMKRYEICKSNKIDKYNKSILTKTTEISRK